MFYICKLIILLYPWNVLFKISLLSKTLIRLNKLLFFSFMPSNKTDIIILFLKDNISATIKGIYITL